MNRVVYSKEIGKYSIRVSRLIKISYHVMFMKSISVNIIMKNVRYYITKCKVLKGIGQQCANESQYIYQAFTVLKKRLLAGLVVLFHTSVFLFRWNNSNYKFEIYKL